MNQQTEALKLALEALEHLQPTALTSFYTIGARDKAITAIRQALAAPVQEPAYYVSLDGTLMTPSRAKFLGFPSGWMTALYTTPPAAQRQWVGLTDEEIDSVQRQYIQQMMPGSRHFARAIESKLREKNT